MVLVALLGTGFVPSWREKSTDWDGLEKGVEGHSGVSQ